MLNLNCVNLFSKQIMRLFKACLGGFIFCGSWFCLNLACPPLLFGGSFSASPLGNKLDFQIRPSSDVWTASSAVDANGENGRG